jgi:hypothetical protein
MQSSRCIHDVLEYFVKLMLYGCHIGSERVEFVVQVVLQLVEFRSHVGSDNVECGEL